MAPTWEVANYAGRPVAVVGGGFLGTRIAASWAAGGWSVNLYDPSAKQRQIATDYISSHIKSFTALTNRSPGTVQTVEDLPGAVKDAWLVIEAIPERLELKTATFQDLEKYAPQDCALGTNSSSYKSSEIAVNLGDEAKKRVLNMHYMTPPDTLVVELMTNGHTSPEIFPFISDRLAETGMHPLHVKKESTGFVANRIWAAIKRETIKILAEGVSTPDQIDGVFKELYRSPAGPCALMDRVGLDVVANIESHYVQELGIPDTHLNWLESNYVSQGRLGMKSDKGGLYPAAPSKKPLKLFVLNMGVAEPLENTSTLEEVLHRGQVLCMDVNSPPKPVELVGHDYMPDGIEIDPATKQMFWTNMGNPGLNDGAVFSANIDGSDVKKIVATGQVHTPKQCAIDHVAKKLYFCDREGLRVMRVNLDGTNLETIIQNGDWEAKQKDPESVRDWCVGIAICRKLGKFYWTQKGPSKASQGLIYSANLDMPKGSTASDRSDKEVVISGLPEPIDLEVDEDEAVLYWTDRGELPLGNTLNRKHLTGDAPPAEARLGRQILCGGFAEAIGLRIDKASKLVWVADLGGRVWKCQMDKPARKVKFYEDEMATFTGLALYQDAE